MNTKVQQMIHDYVEAWNQNTQNDYQEAFSKVWSKDAKYTDPLIELTGVADLVKIAFESLEKFPGRKCKNR